MKEGEERENSTEPCRGVLLSGKLVMILPIGLSQPLLYLSGMPRWLPAFVYPPVVVWGEFNARISAWSCRSSASA
jgi:hypothetical protein